MGPVENMTVGYLVPKRLFQLGSPAIICSTKACLGAATMKSLLKPTGLVCRTAARVCGSGLQAGALGLRA